MLVLGVNLSHDRAACLMRDGEVVVAIEEERLDRIKHSEGFMIAGYFDRLTKVIPMKAITYCLAAADVGLDEVDLVVGNRPLNDGSVQRLERELPIKDKSKIRSLPMPSHHLAHAYAGYFTSPFSDAAVLVVDGVGSRIPGTGRIEKHTIFAADGAAVAPVLSTSYSPDGTDVGLGLFYEFFSAKLGFITKWGHEGFGVYSCGGYTEAGKTMGLAPYGQPRPDWGRLIDIGSDDFAVTVPQLEQAFATWHKAEGNGFHPKERDSWQSPFAKDVSRKAQDELEEAMLHLARRAYELTGKSRLCLSGGVALNSVANQRIAEEGPFSEIYIAPPAGDAGVAIGCASYGYHEILGGTQRKHFDCAATGRRYNRDAVLHAIKEVGDKVTAREATIEEVAALVASHQIVAWVQGGSEIGPRALGQRSIIADPRHPEMRDYLNIVVKHREPFRPYAPSVLAPYAADWFALSGTSPFMLLVPAVHEDKRDLVPAITHVDGTARVQTVEEHVNPEYYRLISAFEKHTGVPLVLNTSYNDAGEPIVETPADALRTFLNTELDYLYLGSYLVEKRDRTQPANHPSTRPLARAGDPT